MKKNKLIELLNKIDGNPEIVVWNGFVDDFQHIDSLVEDNLYRYSEQHLRDYNRYQHEKGREQLLSDEEIKERYKKMKYEFKNTYFDDEMEKMIYDKRKRRIVIINPKERGKSTFDRCGKIKY